MQLCRKLVGVVALMGWTAVPTLGADTVDVYIGTYTGQGSRGIYLLELDREAGTLGEPRLVAETTSPSFLAIHPNKKYLYCVGETPEYRGRSTGSVSAFAIGADGLLTMINAQASEGGGPCHIDIDPAGTHALVANYGGGSVAALPINEDGSLGPASSLVQHVGSSVNPQRQQGPHAHSINLDAGARFAVVADLGLDQVLVYRFDSGAGTLTANDPPFTAVAPGAGPRHFDFHPDGEHAYVINELANTITAFDYDAEAGTLDEIQTIGTLPDDFDGRSFTAEVRVHPNGRFLYGSNRGHNSLAVFQIDPNTGALRLVEIEPTQGEFPRNFCLDPSGRFLIAANQNSDSLVLFRVDPETGALSPTGSTVEVSRPVCVRYLESDD